MDFSSFSVWNWHFCSMKCSVFSSCLSTTLFCFLTFIAGWRITSCPRKCGRLRMLLPWSLVAQLLLDEMNLSYWLISVSFHAATRKTSSAVVLGHIYSFAGRMVFFYRRLFVQFYFQDWRVSFYSVILFARRRHFSRFAISQEKIINNVIFVLKAFIKFLSKMSSV